MLRTLSLYAMYVLGQNIQERLSASLLQGLCAPSSCFTPTSVVPLFPLRTPVISTLSYILTTTLVQPGSSFWKQSPLQREYLYFRSSKHTWIGSFPTGPLHAFGVTMDVGSMTTHYFVGFSKYAGYHLNRAHHVPSRKTELPNTWSGRSLPRHAPYLSIRKW